MTGIFFVWMRYFSVFRKNLVYGIVTTLVEPILYLLSFGFGLGGMIGTIQADGLEVSYRAFVLAGIVGQAILFQAFFEASYGGFIRMYYQKIFQAISVTPVTLSEVLWGELIWDSSRACFAAIAVLMIGVITGDFSWRGALVLIPASFLFSLLFSALGILVAARSRTIESISYPQYLIVFPMFLFSGVFFPLSNLPAPFRGFVEWMPLTPVLSLVRSFVLGYPLKIEAIIVLLFWTVLLVPWSRRAMTRRLIP